MTPAAAPRYRAAAHAAKRKATAAMSTPTLLAALAVIAALAYLFGRKRALATSDGDRRTLHSLPSYHGTRAAMFALAPGLVLLAVLLIGKALWLASMNYAALDGWENGRTPGDALLRGEVARVAEGLDRAAASGAVAIDGFTLKMPDGAQIGEILSAEGIATAGAVDAAMVEAALRHRGTARAGQFSATIVVIAAALSGAGWALRSTQVGTRARNTVETGLRWLLIAAASIAILTTLGIVLALIFNTVKFFGLYSAGDFLFGTTWSPSFGGGSSLGIVPLLWGTFYISAVALIVAVPLGLFAAIYLSEYATPRVRSIAKPMLELLAGIPTIVYGLFALLTVGPMLVSLFGSDGTLGVDWMRGGTSVMTAGLVMGIMLIPFVSSLSDDIINAVPQSLRDGSLGLGATPSETIRNVVLPAALPGIVGAILLAASRAIGETMIVVLGAGAAAQLSMNPFDAMTTVTAKIVSQLTGDSDFSSPEALVAFALGMTLFAITLCLNVVALWFVRTYREQYE